MNRTNSSNHAIPVEAPLATGQTLLDQRLITVSGEQYQAFLALLDQPATDNPGLAELFSRPLPWQA